MKKLNQSGIAHLGLVIILVLFVGVIGAAGYRVYTNNASPEISLEEEADDELDEASDEAEDEVIEDVNESSVEEDDEVEGEEV